MFWNVFFLERDMRMLPICWPSKLTNGFTTWGLGSPFSRGTENNKHMGGFSQCQLKSQLKKKIIIRAGHVTHHREYEQHQLKNREARKRNSCGP